MNTKICKVCKIEKDYTEFHKSKFCGGGVRNTCKLCRREEKKEYLSRDYVKAKQHQNYLNNFDMIKKRTKAH